MARQRSLLKDDRGRQRHQTLQCRPLPDGVRRVRRGQADAAALPAPWLRAGTPVLRDDAGRLLCLASCLGYDDAAATNAELRRLLSAPGFPWDQIVALANHELLAPTLWVRLRDRGLVDTLPPEVVHYLRRAHAVNTVRNDRLRAELLAVLRALAGRGIEPVLLKGAVDLCIRRYGDAGARILRDLDLFVPRADLADAVAALEAIGYRVAPRDPGRFETYFTEMVRPGAIAGLDLQWYISGQRDVLTPEDAQQSSARGTIAGVGFRTLSPAHQVVHNVLHSELQDWGSDAGFVWLRQLLDLAALCRQLGQRVAWPEVQATFAGRGLARVLTKRLYLAHRLLGLPLPPGLVPTFADALHYRRCLGQLRWPALMRGIRLWATLMSPFDVRLLDVIYGSGTGRWRAAVGRVRHGLRLWARYRGQLRTIFAKRRTKFD
jgi:hypothetical protein